MTADCNLRPAMEVEPTVAKLPDVWAVPSQVLGLKARLLGDFRKEGRTKFLGIVERERIVRPLILFPDLGEPTVRS